MIKRVTFFVFSFIALFLVITQIISAEIIINEQPLDLYNLGEPLIIPMKIVTTSGMNGFFQAFLLCNGQSREFYKEYIFLTAGQEKQVSPSVLLVQDSIGPSTGSCVVKATLLDQYILTEEFVVSKLINIELKNQQTEIAPENPLIIEGQVTKESGKSVTGIVEIKIPSIESTVSNTVNEGYFNLNFTFPKETPAGQHLIQVNIYEKDANGNVTNQGFIDYNIVVTQVPTSLEIVFDAEEISPGTTAVIQAVLHDQTGVPMESTAIITLKNSKGKILEQAEKSTTDALNYDIKSDQAPTSWIVYAVSNKLTAERNFTIIEKQEIEMTIVNKTLIITNIGNVVYNKTLIVKIGNETLNLETDIDIGKTQKFVLTAPDGEYTIEIVSEEGNQILDGVALTGKAIDIKKITSTSNIIKHPFVWIFIIVILAAVAYLVFKKGYKKSFFGKKPNNFKSTPKTETSNSEKTIIKTKNRAELSLSIKGEKQPASSICIGLKNLNELKIKEAVSETLNKIARIAEEHKAVIYENNGYLFLLLAPATTKTFKNDKTAIKIAQEIKKELDHHNRMFQPKINFGISLNNGTIVAKKDPESLKFMSLGRFIAASKKIASISDGEIYLSKEIHEKLMTEIKAQKHEKDGMEFYSIKEMKEREESKEFIDKFVKRLYKE